ncbi:MAG: hypothetical protein PHU91_02705 [Candidatus Omnitrophica bacterium]|nr:hypothetical protein [Candidatus Omnitrophota bacterium]MDD5610772.1 hypothetical protein [Candidatus Omnitrophota bacterium]
MSYSKELIQKTLDYWGPKYALIGQNLTAEDAREILDNLCGLIEYLAELDKKFNQSIKNEVLDGLMQQE